MLRTDVFDPLKARLLTFPLVTIAAVHGHCFAGGMILALCCDYRLVTSGRGLWSLNEAVIGIPIVAATAAIVRAKLSPNATRDAVSGKRFNQGDLLRLGVVEEIVEPEKLISRAVEIGKVEGDRARGGSLGSIKVSLGPATLSASHAVADSRTPSTPMPLLLHRCADRRSTPMWKSRRSGTAWRARMPRRRGTRVVYEARAGAWLVNRTMLVVRCRFLKSNVASLTSLADPD
jgi:enoyl-CoA hydratase/carnithine racemase